LNSLVRPQALSWVKALIAALPDAAIAVVCGITWFAPYRFGPYTIKWIVTLMLVEFIVVHSAGFMGSVAYGDLPRLKKGLTLAGLTLFYTAFTAGFSAVMHAWWPLVSFWILCLNRMLGALIGQPAKESEKAFVKASWASAVLFFVLGAFATTVLPVPRFGITAEAAAAQHFGSTGGIWIDYPHRPVAFAVLYFAATALWELFGWRSFSGKRQARSTGRILAERQALAEELTRKLNQS
jgi:hypothetical protein